MNTSPTTRSTIPPITSPQRCRPSHAPIGPAVRLRLRIDLAADFARVLGLSLRSSQLCTRLASILHNAKEDR